MTRYKIRSSSYRWIDCKLEPNELLVDMDGFIKTIQKFGMKRHKFTELSDIAIQEWCDERNINLLWFEIPSNIRLDESLISPPLMSLRSQIYLLVFETLDDAMLAKLSFNSDEMTVY